MGFSCWYVQQMFYHATFHFVPRVTRITRATDMGLKNQSHLGNSVFVPSITIMIPVTWAQVNIRQNGAGKAVEKAIMRDSP